MAQAREDVEGESVIWAKLAENEKGNLETETSSKHSKFAFHFFLALNLLQVHGTQSLKISLRPGRAAVAD